MNDNAFPVWLRAERFIEIGRYADAEREVRNAIAAEPNDPFLHFMLAKCLCFQQKYKPALAEADETIRLDPEGDGGYFIRALVLLNTGKFKKAVEAAKQAVEVRNDDADNLGLLARCYERVNRWQEALDAAELGLSIEPKNARCAAVRADALRALGRRDEARDILRGNLENDPDDAEAHADLGWHALRAGERAEAMVHFREALRIDPTYAWAKAGLASAMQSRSPLYGWFFRFRLWLADKPAWWQWMPLVIAVFAPRLIRKASNGNIWGLTAADIVNTLFFVFWYIWNLLPAIGTVLLWSDREGRRALNDEQRSAVKWFLPTLLLGAAAAAASPWVGRLTSLMLLMPTLVAGIVIPAVYSVRNLRRRRWMGLIAFLTVMLAASPLLGTAVMLAALAGWTPRSPLLLLLAVAPIIWFVQVVIASLLLSLFADTIAKLVAGPEGTQQTIT